VAILSAEGRELRLIRSGHVAPFLVRSGAPLSVTRLETPGPFLGLVPSASFNEPLQAVRHELRPGDLLLLHTDGLEELKGRAGEKFGADRIAGLLRAHAPSEAALVLGALILEAEQFGAAAPRREDVTAVCVKVR
jgi:serine phosphatase RsbU (regulator of sigma subunit)